MTYSRLQIYCLLCLMFFGLLPPKSWNDSIDTVANFIPLYNTGQNSIAISKIQCLLAYFHTVNKIENHLEGNVTYSR